jgi:hypothetical protein
LNAPSGESSFAFPVPPERPSSAHVVSRSEIGGGETSTGVAPSERQVERKTNHLDGLGDVGGRKHDVPVITVPSAARRLEVVALRARHVQDHERQARQRYLGERLLHQRQALPGRAGRRRGSRRRRAPRHPDRFELALGIHARASDVGQQARHVLEHFRERRHRVTGEEPTAGGDHRLGDRFRSFEQPRAHSLTTSSMGSSYL